MKLAVLERFDEPSRRCDVALAGVAGDDVEVWDLPHPLRRPASLARAVPDGIAGWLAGDLSLADRRDLLRAALGTRGARLASLVCGPQLLRSVRRGDVDAVACFSTAEFALAKLLAAAARSPGRELLARGTQYFGEFAFELLAVIPYAHWLHRQGRLDFTVSTPDTRALYYFSPRHVERPLRRRYVPITEYPVGEAGRWRYDRKAFPRDLDTGCWLPPPYRSVFTDPRFRWPKPACVVCNKATEEHYLWHHSPTNFIPTDALLALVGRLRTRYQVIYNRPRAADIVNDHQAIRENGDIEAVERTYPDVLTIQQLQARHPDLGHNELQLRLFAGCERFVSVLGGSSYLASYFGGTNVVYARRGWEVACGAYDRWFARFSGARVVAAATPRELLATVDRELMPGD